jgi:hypothetical protein
MQKIFLDNSGTKTRERLRVGAGRFERELKKNGEAQELSRYGRKNKIEECQIEFDTNIMYCTQ